MDIEDLVKVCFRRCESKVSFQVAAVALKSCGGEDGTDKRDLAKIDEGVNET